MRQDLHAIAVPDMSTLMNGELETIKSATQAAVSVITDAFARSEGLPTGLRALESGLREMQELATIQLRRNIITDAWQSLNGMPAPGRDEVLGWPMYGPNLSYEDRLWHVLINTVGTVMLDQFFSDHDV